MEPFSYYRWVQSNYTLDVSNVKELELEDDDDTEEDDMIRSLPNEIDKMINLESLIITLPYLTTLPDSIGNLVNLQKLTIACANLTNLPDTIWNLVQLTNLYIDKSKINTLSDKIGNLVNLSTLSVSSRYINTLPDTIGNLVNLQKLTLRHTNINVFPTDSMIKLTKLIEFSYTGGPLNTVPIFLQQITGLEWLMIRGTHITSLPDFICNLTHLTTLWISSNNYINTLPNNIGNLINLRELRLHSNNINTLPSTIGNLTQLSELMLSDNELNVLPDSFRNLRNLTLLWLNGNENLTAIPDNFINMNHLADLRIENTRITMDNIPPQIRARLEEEDNPNGDVDAMQVHNAFDKLDIPRYLTILSGYTLNESEKKSNIYDTVVDFFHYYNKLVDVTTKPNKTLKRTTGQPPTQDLLARQKERLNRLLEVLTRLKNASTYNIDQEHLNIIYPTIAFLKQQPIAFKSNYMQTYIQDTYFAYDNRADTISCVKGILERMVFSIGYATLMACPKLSTCKNPIYKELLNLFYGLTEESENFVMLSHWQFANEFTTLINSDPTNRDKSPDQLQAMYKDYLWSKYRESNPTVNFNLISPELKNQIQLSIDKETAELAELQLFTKREGEFYAGKRQRRQRRTKVKRRTRKAPKKRLARARKL
jgi:Leucine-rich repeat (LRR) protein